MRRRSTASAAILAALALAAGACGGDDDGDSAEPLTKAEFIEQADQICEQTNDATQAEVNEFLGGASPTDATLPDVAELVAAGIQDQVSGIRDLVPPEGDEQEVDAILDKADEGAEQIQEEPGSLGRTGVPNPSLEEANQLAVDYGLQVCGS
jgi:hypothetical protein